MRPLVIIALAAALSAPCGGKDEPARTPEPTHEEPAAPEDPQISEDAPASGPAEQPDAGKLAKKKPDAAFPPIEEPELGGRPTTRPSFCADTSGGWPPAYTACKKDDDCTTTSTSCCGCSAGGQLKAIASKFAPCVSPLASDCDGTQPCGRSFHCFERVLTCEKGQCLLGPTIDP